MAPAGGAPGKPRGAPGLIGASGFPLQSSSASSTDRALGPEIELTAQNAAQVLQNPAPVLVQVGSLDEATSKKLGRLRAAAQARLPLTKLDRSTLPSVFNALQIRSEPAVLLMAKGQVACALEDDLSPQSVTAFVEKCAQMLGLEVDLAESASEQLLEAEETEWRDFAAADEIFKAVSASPDLPQASRARATAGMARCAIRQGNMDEAVPAVDSLTSSAFAASPEVKQAVALLQLHRDREHALSEPAPSLDDLKVAAAAAPVDFKAAEAYSLALFWSGDEGSSFDAALVHLRKSRSDEARKLVLSFLEALGPRHPRYAKARKKFSSAVFV